MVKRIVVSRVALVAGMVVLLFAIAPVLASHDAGRIQHDKDPVFCWSYWLGRDLLYADGGSALYRGFGYTVKRKHRLIDSRAPAYETGVKVSFTMPWYKRYEWESTGESRG